ncbi:MAG: DUF58 domain-containing protein, partial [Thermodesulfobacteriota bacterium]
GLLAAAFLLAAALDALWARRRLGTLGVEAPGVVRLSAARPRGLYLRLHSTAGRSRRVRCLPDLPPAVGSPSAPLDAHLPPETGVSRLDVPCAPSRRGHYALERCHVEESSPLGFWEARRTYPLCAEVRVYPDLSRERRQLAALFLRRGGLGVHAQRQVGQGREFEKLREYVPGDATQDLHWKATARRGHPITKVFQVERTQEVYVILDAGRLSTRAAAGGASGEEPEGAGGRPKATLLDRYVAAALVLGLAAERQGDRFGVAVFSDRVLRFLGARAGKAHYGACRDALFAVEPEDAAPDFGEVFAALDGRLRRRALLVFLTSLDDPAVAESFVRAVERVARRHLVLVAGLRPPGVAPLFSEPEAADPGDLYRHLAGHLRWADLAGVRLTLRARGVGFALLEDEHLAGALVTQYLAVKQRQLL